MTWNAATPADNEAISQGASRIRELKSDVTTALTADRNTFPGPNTAVPVFYAGYLKGAEADRPAASVNYPGRMYWNTDTDTIQRVKDDGSGWEDTFLNPATAALHAAGETGLASVGGTVTLDESSNAFSASGAEAVTAVAGWSVGLVFIRWTQDRILTHGGSLVLQRGVSRNVLAGDVSVFRFFGLNQVREVALFGPGAGKDPGDIFMAGGPGANPRSLLCDGASYTRTDYPALFAKIGAANGALDGAHFNVPDFRGLFPRGADAGAGNDPDAAARTAPRTGAASGDAVGSLQADAFKAHVHTVTQKNGQHGATGGSGTLGDEGSNSGSTGGNETRPKNVGVQFLIAY